MESHQNKWDHKDNLKMLNPTQSKRNGKIVMLGRMVHYMRGPKEPVMMRDTVRPIAAKVVH